jgi:hypothetical protein
MDNQTAEFISMISNKFGKLAKVKVEIGKQVIVDFAR